MLECHSLGFCFCYSLAFAATSLIAHSLLCRLLLVCILHVWDNWFARNSSIRQCWSAKVDSAEGSVVLNNGDTEGRELRDHFVIRHISNFPYSTIFQRLTYCGRWYLLGDITNTVVVMICNQGGSKRYYYSVSYCCRSSRSWSPLLCSTTTLLRKVVGKYLPQLAQYRWVLSSAFSANLV